jgi:hypothetical protein
VVPETAKMDDNSDSDNQHSDRTPREPRPKHVQFRPHLPRQSMNFESRQSIDSTAKANGGRRASKSIDVLRQEEGKVNEQSPLLGPRGNAGMEEVRPLSLSPLQSPESGDSWDAEGNREESKSSWYLFLLTLALGG